MTVRRLPTAFAILFTASMSASYAGPCTQAIDSTQAKFDAKLDAQAAVGPTAPESHAATAHHQPTPDSIAGAEENLGVLSDEQVAAFTEALGRARKADRVGDLSACEQALNQAQGILGEEVP
jgi:hypothetical protein